MTRPLSLFEGFGIELEYMIVDSNSLDIKPVADEIMHAVTDKYDNEVKRNELAWSNELVLHVVELKTNGPVKNLVGIHKAFHEDILEINEILNPFTANLLGTAMHPWMNPHTETRLWPHEYTDIYKAYNRIFDCKGHGWSNLQSMHINLPFSCDDDFVRLHTAIRAVLPLLPALSASSPLADGKNMGFQDYRMQVYCGNSRRIPSITGNLIPEQVGSIAEYHETILNTMYKDIREFDTEGLLQEEWLNSRGAIARFDRNAIEIRVMDIQECPLADIALAVFVISIIKSLVYETCSSAAQQSKLELSMLSSLFQETIKNGSSVTIQSQEYLSIFGYDHRGKPHTVLELLRFLLERQTREYSELASYCDTLDVIVNKGNLATRILGELQNNIVHEALLKIYSKLANCLQTGELFVPDS